MVLNEEVDYLERLMKTIENNLDAFEGHIDHMQKKLDEIKKQDNIYDVQQLKTAI
ncbi:MAG: hypothetical protein ACI383_13020 [Rummeliibacillus sp.]